MNLEEIRELIALMKENQISEIKIDTEEQKIRIKSAENSTGVPSTTIVQSSMVPMVHAGQAGAVPQSAQLTEPVMNTSGNDPADIEIEDDDGFVITSPIVGVFYRSSSPDKPAFVDEGDEIDANSVLCIIEAMKVMNEIKAEMSGLIKSILVDNGQAVEYGQPLFIIEQTD